MPQTTIAHWLSHLRVGQKISLGYAVALGIAVSGTTAGIGIGNHYYQKATEQEDHTRNELELLHRLQSAVLQVRTHQQQLLPLAQFPEKFDEEYAHIQEHRQLVKQSWSELNAFVATESIWIERHHTEDIPIFLQTYQGVPEAYLQELERRVQQIHRLNLASPNDAAQAQQIILSFTNSDLALQFDGISDDLVELLEHAYVEFEAAEAFQTSSAVIAQRIVLVSITLSVAVAILLAMVISQVIARPIQNLTQIAQRSTEESNFDLQAVVESQDEIGVLAHSFNQLIQSVKQLFAQQQNNHEQLAAYNQTLEQRVEERTQELKQKNDQLQDLLEKLHQSQIQMVQNEKMSSLGHLVAGVAHEINNPVNFIHGNLAHVAEYANNLLLLVQLYQRHDPIPTAEIEAIAQEIDLDFLQEDLPKLLHSMRIGTDRIRQIVLSLRNFSRLDESEFKLVDLHEGIDSTLLILKHRLRTKAECPEIEIIREYGDLPPVECCAGQLNQVFMNILVNAIDALEETELDGKNQGCSNPPHRVTIRTVVVDAEWVQIAISDNGCGIPEAIQTKIFDPFFTTKPIGKGTGMGMAISHQIITEKHGGKMECFSTPGKGTEFLIHLPVQQRSLVKS